MSKYTEASFLGRSIVIGNDTSGIWSLQDHYQARVNNNIGDIPATPVLDSLVLFLDANNTESYSGSGTTWVDISTNKYDFTVNGSAWQSGSPAYFDFNGSYGMASRTSVGDVPVGGNVTYVMATRIKNTTADWRTLTRGYTYTADHHVIIESGSYDVGMYDGVTGGNNSAFSDSGFDQTSFPNHATTDWMILYFRWNSGTGYEMSWNDTPGTIRADLSGVGSNASHGTGIGTIGGLNNTSQYWGDIGFFMVYNKRLSDAECLQNYEAFKNSYGL